MSMNNYYGNMMPVNGGFQQQPAMMQYATNIQKPLMTQPLQKDEAAVLQNKGGAGFSTKITTEEMYRSYCTHKSLDSNNNFNLIPNADGTVTCPICGATIDVKELVPSEVQEHVDAVLNDMENIKLCYLDISPEVARQYFPIMPLLEKLPKLAALATANFSKYEAIRQQGAINSTNINPYGVNAYNQLLNGGIGAYGAMTQPMPMYNANMGMGTVIPQGLTQQTPVANPMNPMGGYPMYPQQQPVYQQPMGQPPVGVQTQGMMTPGVNVAGNEFGTYGAAPAPVYNAPTAQVQPPVTPAATVPPVAPVTQQAPANQPAASTKPPVNVDTAKFKI